MFLNRWDPKQPTLYSLHTDLHDILGIDCSRFFRVSSELRMLERYYREPWRQYHVLDHIVDGLRELITHLPDIPTIERKMALLRAWYYHDVFYAPGFGFNEEFSAGLAEANPPKQFPRELNALVNEHILATKQHVLTGDLTHPDDTALLIDIDLKRLAGPPEEVEDDNTLVIMEYCSAYPRELVRAERAKWARNFAAERPRIFQSGAFGHLEDTARENLEYIAELCEA